MQRWMCAAALAAVTAASISTSLRVDAAADATRPENDRVAQLERQVAELQRRLERLEAADGVRPAVQQFVPDLPDFAPAPETMPGAWPSTAPRTTYLPPNHPWTSVVPQLVPVPPTQPDTGHEINGIKYKVFLISSEREKKSVDGKTPPLHGGAIIRR